MFTVIGSPSRDPAAIFASTRSSLVQLPIGNYYRLDYLEVAPNLRRSGLGVLAFAMVAVRAAEHGATGIILTSFNEPGLIQFYLDAGGVQECPRGWNAPANVVPFRFGNDALSRLQDIAHAHLDDP